MHLLHCSRFLMTGLVLCLWFSLFLPAGYVLAEGNPPPQSEEQDQVQKIQDNILPTLKSILELRSSLENQLREKRKLFKRSLSESEKEQLQQEITQLEQQIKESEEDFTRISTGIELEDFRPARKEEKFDLKREMTFLLKPLVSEMKQMTARVRQQAQLKVELEQYAKLLPETQDAIRNLTELLKKTSDKTLKKQLRKELATWKNRQKELENKQNIAKMQLEQLSRTKMSVREELQESIKHFFRTRGMYLFMSLLTVTVIIGCCWLLHRFLTRILPGYRQEHIPLRLRVLDLGIRVMTFFLAVIGLFGVLYAAQDWVLLSMSIILLIGIGWTARQTIPKIWNQSQLMLNIGSVREGERIVIDGIPWLVRKINVFTIVENPDLGVTLRLPIGRLLDMESRPFRRWERWFPCKREDWVILADGTRGKVVSQSHEAVELVQRGGARRMYRTSDFLALAPLNLSSNFRLKVPFGISYDLQKEATKEIPETLRQYLSRRIGEEGYGEHLKNLRIEFMEAAESSLNLVVIADFDGEMAPLYNRMRRSLQKWCVEACTREGWEIPFPQLTVHKAGERKEGTETA
ncbi:hypothetical protein [Desulfolithobacter sp.]